MLSVSVSELQRKMNEIIMPKVLAGETVQVIDKKTGEVKFHIVAPGKETEIDWSDLSSRLIELESSHPDPVGVALDTVRGDRDFSALF
jgi:hypothetical protein